MSLNGGWRPVLCLSAVIALRMSRMLNVSWALSFSVVSWLPARIREGALSWTTAVPFLNLSGLCGPALNVNSPLIPPEACVVELFSACRAAPMSSYDWPPIRIRALACHSHTPFQSRGHRSPESGRWPGHPAKATYARPDRRQRARRERAGLGFARPEYRSSLRFSGTDRQSPPDS